MKNPAQFAIISGDLINSRESHAQAWLGKLKEALNYWGAEPQDWEIFRGDSFQLKVNVEDAFLAALHIKACVKQIDPLDARMAIGIGEISHNASKITEANGTAFLRSGELFDALKKQNLAIASDNQQRDEWMNASIMLALLTVERWQPAASTLVQIAIENPTFTQKELARRLGKSQSTISESLSRAGFAEIMTFNQAFKNQF